MSDASPILCRQCGAELRAGMIRCRECGTIVRRDAAAPAAAPAEEATPAEPETPAVESSAAPSTRDAPARRSVAKRARRPAPASAPVETPEARVGVAERPEVLPQGAEAVATAVKRPSALRAAVGRARERAVFKLSAVGAALAGRVMGRRTLTVALGGFLAATLGLAAWFWPRGLAVPREVERVLAAPGERLTSLVIAPDGRHAAAGCGSGRVVAWELAGSPPQVLPECGGEPILSLVLSGDSFLIAGATDATLYGWENAFPPSKAKLRKQAGLSAAIACLAVRPQRHEMVLGLSTGDLLFFGQREPLRKETPQGLRVAVYSPDDGTLVTGAVDGGISWRDPKSGEPQGETFRLTAEIGALAFSDDGALLVVGDWNGKLAWFEGTSHKPRASLSQPDAVSGAAVVGGHVVTASWDGRLRLWSRGSEGLEREIDAGRPLVALAVVPGGRQLATATADGRVLLWSLAAVRGK